MGAGGMSAAGAAVAEKMGVVGVADGLSMARDASGSDGADGVSGFGLSGSGGETDAAACSSASGVSSQDKGSRGVAPLSILLRKRSIM